MGSGIELQQRAIGRCSLVGIAVQVFGWGQACSCTCMRSEAVRGCDLVHSVGRSGTDVQSSCPLENNHEPPHACQLGLWCQLRLVLLHPTPPFLLEKHGFPPLRHPCTPSHLQLQVKVPERIRGRHHTHWPIVGLPRVPLIRQVDSHIFELQLITGVDCVHGIIAVDLEG